MLGSVAIILINYKDYAEKYLAECLSSIRKQDYQGKIKIFIVDNETTPKTAVYLMKHAPEAELILNKNNDGFAKGNNDGIKLALAQGFEYVILFNLDTVVEKNCVSEMVRVAENNFYNNVMDPRLRGDDRKERGDDRKEINPLYQGGNKEIGAVQARLMLWPGKNKINSLGNTTHYLGFGFGTGYKEKYSRPHTNPLLQTRRGDTIDICYPSGAAVLFKSEILKKIGLFDEEYWMYNEDQDIGWRIWLAGYRCVLADKAVIYHKYEFTKSIKQFYWLDRNRIISMVRNYRLPTLILIFPAFVIMEIGLILFSLKSGWFKEKIKVWRYFLNLNHWRYLIKARHEVKKIRRIKDKDIIYLFSGKISHQEVDDAKLRLINPFFNLYWLLVKKIVWW